MNRQSAKIGSLIARLALALAASVCMLSVGTARAQEPSAQVQKAMLFLENNWRQQQVEALKPKAQYNSAQLQIWESLDQAHTHGLEFKAILNSKTSDEYNVAIDWLYDQILNHNASGPVEFLYAGLLYQAFSRAPQAVLQSQSLFMAANLATRIDGGRCADPSVAGNVLTVEWAKSFVVPVMNSLDSLDENAKFKLRLNAAALEIVRGPREPQSYMCHYGNQATIQSFTNDPSSASVQKQPDGSTRIGVNTESIPVKLVDDATWSMRRDQLIARSQVPKGTPP